MNEEREDTELAELLKQLPAPTRLDASRRNTIFAALPQGCAPHAKTHTWGRIVSFAALLVLVVGVLWGLLFPAGPLALEPARKLKAANAASMSLGEEKADYSYCVAMDALVDEPPPAPPAVTAPAAAPAKPAVPDVSGSLDEHPQEKQREDEGRMDVDGFAKALAERSPDFDLKDAEAPAPVTPRPAEMEPVAIVKSPIVMRGIVGSRTPGQRGKALQSVEQEEALRSVGDARDSAAGPFGGSLSAGKAEVADKEASAEDWEGFFSELGVEWPKNPDGSPVTVGVGLSEAEAQPRSSEGAEPEVVADYRSRVAMHRQEGDGPQHDPFSELATLERSRRKLFDDHARDMLAEGQAALRDRKPAVALEKFVAAKKFLVANEENREAIEQVHAGMREAYDFLPRGAAAAVSDAPTDEMKLVERMKGSTITFCDRAAPTGALVHKMFLEIPPDLLPESAKGNADVPIDQYKDTEASKAAKAFFGQLGVEWPQGSTCHYSAEIGCLIVLTTQENLNVLEKTLARLKENATPKKCVGFGPFTLIPTAEHPLSTFGLDVDSAGYSRAVSLIDEGARPDAATIRQEEFINAFDYGDLAPAEATFRVYLEGAASPFRPGNHLLRVGVKGRRFGREEQRPLRLTILLDASGSMDTPERMALAKRAIQALLAKLSPDDTVTLLTCSDKTRKIFVLSGWDQPETAKRAGDELAAIRCQGATNLEDGIVRAFESASADFAPDAENRVVILSDGIANLGSANAEEILAKVAANRDRGISCSVIGVGRSTYNDTLLEAMANRGNGQYRFLDSEASIHESFVEDLQNSFNTIAADVKIQVEWNAAAVKAYRSHGYDSRALRDEQFRDDSVDAGEVGSGQGVTVVYEMQLEEGLKPAATLGTVRIRYRRIDTGAVEEIEAPIAAEAVQRDFGRARPQFRLACAVAEFATALKHVPPAAQANALQAVAAEANRAAAELNYYAPARDFTDAVRKLMGIGL